MKLETKEAWLRIPIGIVVCIISKIWGILIFIIILLNFIYTIFNGKRNRNLAEFSNIYVSFIYSVIRYFTFTTNQRPFPFGKLEKEKEKIDFKFQN